MKILNTNPRIAVSRVLAAVVLTTIVALLETASPALAGKGNAGNPGIIPPQASFRGKTYGEWSAAWWKWAYSLPTSANPQFDTADCSAGQAGNVWFLGGTFTVTEVRGVILGQAERHCTVPPGTALFFPILNHEFDNVGFEPPFSVEELYALAQSDQNHVVLADCVIDGKSVQGMTDPINTPYRVQSPVFSFTLPEQDNVYQYFGVDVSGLIEPAVADGIFLMLAPLSAGKHTIHFQSRLLFTEAADGFALDFNLDITYHITVQP